MTESKAEQLGPSTPANFPPQPNLLKAKETPRSVSSSPTFTISFFTRLFGSFAAPSPAVMSAAKTKAQGLIDQNAVVVFSKSYCPYCTSSKSLLRSFDANFTVVELDEESEYSTSCYFSDRLPFFGICNIAPRGLVFAQGLDRIGSDILHAVLILPRFAVAILCPGT